MQARGERYPEFEFGVGLERNFAVLENSLKFSLGVELPLFDSKGGEVIEKKAELASTKALLSSLEVSIEGKVRGALEEARLRLTKVRTFSEKLLPTAEEALKLANAGHKEGKFSFLDVLDAQRTLSEIKVEHLEAVKELNNALLRLEELQVYESGK